MGRGLDGQGRGPSNRRGSVFSKAVATIGVFDGIHRGHQMIFQQVLRRAEETRGSSVVVTFDPYPGEVFRPEVSGRRLQTPAQRRRLLLELGFHGVVELVFSTRMAQLSPAQFFENVLLAHADLRELYTGYDFRFGRDREGSFLELQALGAERGIEVLQVPALVEGGTPISSSRIRSALAEGDIDSANCLLGRPHALEGRVRRGRGEGARLLVPTANLEIDPRILLPQRGVYIVEADVEGRPLAGVMNVGCRPTLTRDEESHVEVHILDWDGDLVGKSLQVFMMRRLRPEARFPSLEALRSAIRADIARAREWLGHPQGIQSTRPRG
jgi:riboflavin kinase/FMN adenylyltransferase